MSTPVSAKIVVGYKLRPAPQFSDLMPAFNAPARWKDQSKIDEFVRDKEATFAESAKAMPYAATFDSVFLSAPQFKKIELFAWSDDRGIGKAKPPICLAVAAWLLRLYPNAWHNDTSSHGAPKAVFVGFDPRLFLKILGLECSMPGYNMPLPLGLWHNNNDHRDIINAIIPTEFEKDLDTRKVLLRRGVKPKEDWRGPGFDPVEDVRLAFELGTQLGMLPGKLDEPK